MTNEEIGTYQICEAIEVNPKLKVQKTKKQITAKINGIKYIGNLRVIKKCVNTAKLSMRKSLMDNSIFQEKTAKEVLSDVFGISENKDFDLVYDAGAIWKKAKTLANKEIIVEKVNKFKLDTENEDRRLT